MDFPMYALSIFNLQVEDRLFFHSSNLAPKILVSRYLILMTNAAGAISSSWISEHFLRIFIYYTLGSGSFPTPDSANDHEKESCLQ